VLVSIGIIVLGTAVCVAASMLTSRARRQRRIRYDKSPMAGDVFGVIGTGFTVILAFVIFTAFESYQRARDAAGVESVATRQMEYLTESFPQQSRVRLQGDLVCYARAVVYDEWPLMASGRSSPVVDHWVTEIDTSMVDVPIASTKEVEVFNMWFQRSAERQDGRRGRLAEAAPLIPPFVWAVLILLLVVVIGYQILFVRAGLPLVPQAFGVGATAATLVAGLVLIYVLDMPWMLESSGPAADLRTSTEAIWKARGARQSRYFAFGFDAATLAVAVRKPSTAWPLNGLTGRLNVTPDGRVERSLQWARVGSGGVVQPGDPAAQ
jgi:uncharacterized membrane protein